MGAGAKVGIWAPASPARRERVESGISYLKRQGLTPVMPVHPAEFYGRYDHAFSNGSASARCQVLYDLLEVHRVDLVLCARGAFGAIELLPELDWDRLKKHSVPLVGYSDVTMLLAACEKHDCLRPIHGPTLSKEFADAETNDSDAKRGIEELNCVLGTGLHRRTVPVQAIRPGRGAGAAVAGNLASLCALIGTPWEVDFAGRVLFLEEVGEAPYRVYRSLLQLVLSGRFDDLQGLVFGSFSGCTAPHGPTVEETFDRVTNEFLADKPFPVMKGFPFGHAGLNLPLAFDAQASIDGGHVELTVNSNR
ncbi:MAG: LD-carboxypeptidase [Bdellovibrionales bacterium]|nr:LD-carboxypeptidase [Bdellovibrionales bacterium]